MLAQNLGVPGSVYGAATELGAGDQLQQQLEADLIERRKKMTVMATQSQNTAVYGAMAAMSNPTLGMGNMGAAAQTLLNPGGMPSG